VIGEERRALHRKALGAAVRTMRRELDWTQEDLGVKLEVDQRQIARIEAGRVPATLELIEELAEVLGTSSLSFIASTVRSGEDNLLSLDEFHRWGMRAIEDRFRRQVARPDVAQLVRRTVDLTDPQLRLLLAVADNFVLRSQLAPSLPTTKQPERAGTRNHKAPPSQTAAKERTHGRAKTGKR
jgi:transcriptional regulator with XRE-family HTH domain